MKISQNDIISVSFYLANNANELFESQICLNTAKHIFLWSTLTANNFIVKLQSNLVKADWLQTIAPILRSAELIQKHIHTASTLSLL